MRRSSWLGVWFSCTMIRDRGGAKLNAVFIALLLFRCIALCVFLSEKVEIVGKINERSRTTKKKEILRFVGLTQVLNHGWRKRTGNPRNEHSFGEIF